MIQRLGSRIFPAKGTGSVSGQGTKIPQAAQHRKKKKKNTNSMDDNPQNSLSLSLLFHPCPFSELSLSNFSSQGLEHGDRLARASWVAQW